MSRDSAADPVVRHVDQPSELEDLRSLNEGIALLTRLEQVLADMQLSMDSLSLARS